MRNARATPRGFHNAEVPAVYGRPWAQIWEKYWDQRMAKSEGEFFDFGN